MFTYSEKKLGELLVEAGILSEEQLNEALEARKGSDKKIGEVIIDKGFAAEKQIMEFLEYQLKIPLVDFNKINIQANIPRLISEAMARKHNLIPISKDGNIITVAMADPLDIFAIDDVRMASGLEVKPLLGSKKEILTFIDKYYGRESAERAVEDFKKEYNLDEISEIDEEAPNELKNAPVVRFVNSILRHAMKIGASDIHIEPLEKHFRVRFRVDGELQEIMKSSKTAHSAVVTRIKIMGKMDIAEKRIPQDGRVEFNIDGKEIDLRLSVLPTVYGEKVVIRLLGRSDLLLSRSMLGFSSENEKLFDQIIKSPNGIILVSGPTGSGKTTTLYAVLTELNKITSNIITVEDPVEYRLEGINQVQVNTKAGLTFASGLRSILRQDPDIIMIGEMRDSETAQIGVRAAITGHIVLSTIHTNDSASTVSRLVDMGIEPYLVSSSVVGIIAQRLVRKICKNCKTSYRPEPAEMMLLKLRESQPLYRGKGCAACNFTGYRGRTAIHEILVVNREIRELIDRRATIDQIRHMSLKSGTVTLRDSCTRLVLDGITTIDELTKVTYSMD